METRQHITFTKEELEKEEWIDILTYDYIYQISNLGRFKRVTAFHKNKIGIITTGGIDARGYMRINVVKNGKRISKKIHRLVAQYFLEKYSEDLTVNHKNFIKFDNRVINLEMLTSVENSIDYVLKNKKHGTLGVLGISFDKFSKKWLSKIKIDGKWYKVGEYTTELEAIEMAKSCDKEAVKIPKKGGKRKLSNKQISELILLSETINKREIALIFKVSYQTVYNMINKYQN